MEPNYSLPTSTMEPDRSPERPKALDWNAYSDSVMSAWYALLAGDPEENQVQEFLELHPAMIPGGSGDVGPGGHHGSEMRAVFRRPPLKGGLRDREPDFLWVTRSSSLITPILVEIEKPSKRWFRRDGVPTAAFTEAHSQLNDWRDWFSIAENQSLFRRRYLFNDDYRMRTLEPWFVLIYGRRSEFEHGGGHSDPEALLRKRDGMRATHEQFMSFDSLIPRYDHREAITLSMTATGPRLYAFSPVHGTSPETTPAAAARLGDPTDALERSVMMSKERKAYLRERWLYWGERHEESARSGSRPWVMMGSE